MRCTICQTNAHTTTQCAWVIKSSKIGSLYRDNITPTMRKRSEYVPIQNLPGTPASALEMYEAKYGLPFGTSKSYTPQIINSAIDLYELLSTPAAEIEFEDACRSATLSGTGFMKDGKHIPNEDVYIQPLPFPCFIKFMVHPYHGEPRTAVYLCQGQDELDAKIDWYLSDTTGNTKRVTHSLYVKPNVQGSC